MVKMGYKINTNTSVYFGVTLHACKWHVIWNHTFAPGGVSP